MSITRLAARVGYCPPLGLVTRLVTLGTTPLQGLFDSYGILAIWGKTFSPQYGEGWLWRHWGCVTPDILTTLRKVKVAQIDGWSKVRSNDRSRVMTAIKAGRVAPGDIPASAKPLDWSLLDQTPVTSSQSTVVGQKRKSETSSSAPSTQVAVSQTIDLDDSEDEFGVVPAEEVPKDEHYIDLNSQVVGVQYYKGLVGHNEQVNLVREPHNIYDKNAIQVPSFVFVGLTIEQINLAMKQVGHLKKEVSARLSPLIDANMIVVEGTIRDAGTLAEVGHARSARLYRCITSKYKYQAPAPPSTQVVGGYGAYGSSQPSTSYGSTNAYGPYGTTSQKDQAAKLDAERRAKLAAERLAYKKAEELKAVIKSFETVDDETRRSSLLDTLCSNEDILNLPLHESPPSIASGELTTNLMKHQIQALQWCLNREYPTLPKKPSDTPVQFWQYTTESRNPKPTYVNLISRQPVALDDAPSLGRGAIFADSMGLGKTLSMISLNHCHQKRFAPVSVLRTWEAQILEHCASGLLSVYTYHEKGREIAPNQLQKYDVVITSYSGKQAAGAGPSKKQKGTSAIYSIAWKRIVLDEGHTIRNAKTKQHEALCNLKAERRWVVTGTPIINSPKDLGSLLNFLKVCKPLDELDYFNRALIRPLSKGDPSSATLLKGLMSQICLRRTKEMQNAQGEYLVDLPPVEMTVVRVALDDETRMLYDEIERLSRERFMRHIDGNQCSGTNLKLLGYVQIPSNTLAMLTRLRQLTLHRSLVPNSYLEELRLLNIEDGTNVAQLGGATITPAERLRLQNRLFQIIEDNEECPVCFDIMTSPRITPCAHAFCLDCIAGVIQRDPKCPMDRGDLGLSDLIEPLPPTDATQAQIRVELDSEDEEHSAVAFESSAKIDQLIHLLQLTPATEKLGVVRIPLGEANFGNPIQIAEHLAEAEIPFVRFDGSITTLNEAVGSKRNSKPSHSRRIVESDDEDEKGNLSSCRPWPILLGSASSPSRQTRSATVKLSVNVLSSDDEEHVEPVREKRPRLSFLPELTSDEDDLDNAVPVDLATTNRANGNANALATDLPSDDYDPSAEPSKTKEKARAVSSTRRKVVERQAVLRSYDIDEKVPVVMLISLKAGALGLQLTAANNVYLMDPQMVAGHSLDYLGFGLPHIDNFSRVGGHRKPGHRSVQSNRPDEKVHVFQLVMRRSYRREHHRKQSLEIQERKRLLIKQAFSGTKSKETQRSTKKEARLQDLIELLGVRRELASTDINNKRASSIHSD
ncbi:hypothetical protein BS47DRAFT_1359131 [Hydnum rufescens UP504]|uniref:Uncharacterized protein n=1 Tax=Hydnum rufescens UP504 TaxID=1448309 RepID=A0A9P6B6A8_9AGAM|nr:hypothetical protein BS47DRAFT_1359131 [Hydnum rufescens UP504]